MGARVAKYHDMSRRSHNTDIVLDLFEGAGKVRLDEINYKDLLHAIDPRDLPHRDYAPLIQFVRYIGTRKGTMKFFLPNRYNGWNTYVRFEAWNTVVNDATLNLVEASRLLMWSSDVKCYCPCPSFKFHGYQYILTQLDASLVPEERFPHVRNPQLKNVACKHLRRTIKVLPFHMGNLANAISQERMRRGIHR